MLNFVSIACLTLTASFGFAELQKPTVVVIGAGLAGLTTAYRLQQQGMEVHLYEARNRVGGRVFSAKIGDQVVELGGQNIYDGGEAEHLHRLIDELHFELKTYRIPRNYFYFTEGQFIPGHLLAQRVFDPDNLRLQLTEIASRTRTMRDVLNELFQEEDLLYKTLSVRLAAYEGGTIDHLSSLYVNTLYYMLLGGSCCVHAEPYFDVASIQGGNSLLAEAMAKSLKGRIHLSMPLATVIKTSDASYELMFQNGERVRADILVLAIPCPTYEDICFEETVIPKERLRSIRQVGYGTNAKILVPLDQPVPENVILINDQMIGFCSNDHSVLTLYYTGEAAKFSEESIVNTYRQERRMLEQQFGEVCPYLAVPKFAQDISFASYEGPVGYSWPNDPYAKGSYSYIAQGQEAVWTAIHEENGEMVKSLFAPVDHTLFFAGEHASILMEVPGTMEAACESGERTARMIVKTWREGR